MFVSPKVLTEKQSKMCRLLSSDKRGRTMYAVDDVADESAYYKINFIYIEKMSAILAKRFLQVH